VPTDPPTTAQGLDVGAAGDEPAALFYGTLTFAQPWRHPVRDHFKVMRKLLATVAVSTVLAGALAAAGLAGPPAFPNLPGDWSHAEINVKIKRTPHTLILDRGRVTQVNATQLTLREADGSVVVVPIASATIYKWLGIRPRGRILHRGLFALTMRVDAGAAVRVRLSRIR
jgi:hypothetical protein